MLRVLFSRPSRRLGGSVLRLTSLGAVRRPSLHALRSLSSSANDKSGQSQMSEQQPSKSGQKRGGVLAKAQEFVAQEFRNLEEVILPHRRGGEKPEPASVRSEKLKAMRRDNPEEYERLMKEREEKARQAEAERKRKIDEMMGDIKAEGEEEEQGDKAEAAEGEKDAEKGEEGAENGEEDAEKSKEDLPEGFDVNTEERQVVEVETKRSVWSQRIETLTTKFRDTPMYKQYRKARAAVMQSDNVVVEKGFELRDKALDKVEDMREMYETSQHPLMWKLRDLEEAIGSESEQAYAMSKLLEVDPWFNEIEFVEEMKRYMIPTVIGAFLSGNQAVLNRCATGQALHLMNASIKERQTLGHYWDPVILNIDMVEVAEVVVEEERPLVILSFRTQEHDVTRNKKHEVVKGMDGQLKYVIYRMALERDYDNLEFDWKVHVFYFQQVLSLI